MSKFGFLVLLLTIFSIQESNATSYSHASLSDLYKKADAVVYGKVVRFEEIAERNTINDKDELALPPPIFYKGRIAIIITEVIKGNITETEICIGNMNDINGLGLPEVEIGQNLLLFLFKGIKEEKYMYFSMGRQFTGRDIPSDEYEIYKQKLISLQSVLNIKDPKVQEQHYINWMISCVKEPLTKWDGIFDLKNKKYVGSKDVELVANPYQLNTEQYNELCEEVYQAKELSYDDIQLIAYLYESRENKELLAFLSQRFNEIKINKDNFSKLRECTLLIAKLSKRNDLVELSEYINSSEPMSTRLKKIKEFKEKI